MQTRVKYHTKRGRPLRSVALLSRGQPCRLRAMWLRWRTAMKRMLGIALAVGLGVVAGSAAVLGMRAPPSARFVAITPVWAESKWPFPIDQWGIGEAFVC